MLDRLNDQLKSLTKSFDVIYAYEGAKPVSRLILDSDANQSNEFLKILSDNNLNYELSDFKIVTHTDSSRNYTDKGIISKGNDSNGKNFIYISKDQKKAKEAKTAEEKGDHLALGRLLGYPDCCIKFFADNFESASLSTNDLTPSTFFNSKGLVHPWQTNNCLRGFDISLLSHFPCNFNCDESKKIAEKNLEIIKKYNSDISNYFKSALKCGLIYSEGVGVYSFRKMRQTVSPHIFEYHPNEVIASSKNDVYNILRRRNQLKIYGKNKFAVEEVLIEDNNTYFGLFL